MDDGEDRKFPFIGRYFKLPEGERVEVKSDFFSHKMRGWYSTGIRKSLNRFADLWPKDV